MAPGNDEPPSRSKQKVSFAEGDAAAVVVETEESPTATTPAPQQSSDSSGKPAASRSSLERPSMATRESEVLRATARESLAMLLEGNARFCAGKLERCRADPEALADGASDDRARPAAVVLACSDARAPPELLFDAALGDLHVVRVAGGGVSPSRASPAPGGGGGGGDASPKGDVVLASVLDGVLRGGARCVVVLGHSRCDAVVLAIEGWALLEARRKAAAAAAGGETGPPLAARCPSSSSTPSSVPASASSSPFASASQSPAASPLKAAAATHHRSRKGSEKERGGGFFARLFGRNSSAALPVSPDAFGSGAGGNALHARRRTSSLEKKASQGAGASSAAETRGGSALGGNENSNHGPSHSHAQPLAAIADALSGAVEAVARGVSGGRFAKLATSMLSSSWNNLPAAAAGGEAGNGGGEEDAEDLSAARRRAAVALRSQDSIGIAHARFAKQRAQVACDEADAEGCVDDVVDEHVRRTVAAVLQALMRAADAATARSVEVVGMRADLATGRVAVLRTGWVGARGGALYE